MFRVLLWSAVVVLGGGVALFIPIDPALIKAVGLSIDAPRQDADTSSRKFSADSALPGDNLARRSRSAPISSPVQTDVRSTSARVRQIAIAPAPQLVADAAIAARPTAAPVSAEIIRGLQSELRRVGCYDGRVDGDWGPASRFAMAAFIRSANASLPSERPDAVLLSLVRRHPAGACGSTTKRAPTITTAAVVPEVRVSRVNSWRTRVASTRQQPKLLQPPVLVSSGTLAVTDRIKRGNPRYQVRRNRIVVADPFARTQRRATPFAGTRMSLGGLPAASANQPSITAPGNAAPQPYGAGPRTQPRFAQPHLVGPRLAEPRYDDDTPRARRGNAKPRRYSRRRNRSRNWRRKVFPGLYN